MSSGALHIPASLSAGCPLGLRHSCHPRSHQDGHSLTLAPLWSLCFLDLRSSSCLHLFPHFATPWEASWDRAPVRYILVTCRSELFSIWPSHSFSSLSEWNSMFMINFSVFWTLYPTVFWFPGLLLRSPVSFDTGLLFVSSFFTLWKVYRIFLLSPQSKMLWLCVLRQFCPHLFSQTLGELLNSGNS